MSKQHLNLSFVILHGTLTTAHMMIMLSCQFPSIHEINDDNTVNCNVINIRDNIIKVVFPNRDLLQELKTNYLATSVN